MLVTGWCGPPSVAGCSARVPALMCYAAGSPESSPPLWGNSLASSGDVMFHRASAALAVFFPWWINFKKKKKQQTYGYFM